jgi:lipid II:glycine glycyltransferase (peptidoglycan interpeptide bridge formation enzyme)
VNETDNISEEQLSDAPAEVVVLDEVPVVEVATGPSELELRLAELEAERNALTQQLEEANNKADEATNKAEEATKAAELLSNALSSKKIETLQADLVSKGSSSGC